MNDADTTFFGNGDCKSGLGHGIHGGRDYRQIQFDTAGKFCCQRGIARQDLREIRNQQDIIKGQGFF